VFVPCIDFGHINAREQGSLKTKADYLTRLQYLIDELGYERMKHFHIHFSKIMYSVKGEIKHLTFEDEVYGPEFAPLAEALKELKFQGILISIARQCSCVTRWPIVRWCHCCTGRRFLE
jgi:deoxyribonuclease-4